jgi:hypothetical protein
LEIFFCHGYHTAISSETKNVEYLEIRLATR